MHKNIYAHLCVCVHIDKDCSFGTSNWFRMVLNIINVKFIAYMTDFLGFIRAYPKKELVYLLLPIVLLLILFPTVIFPNNTLITGSADTLLIINSELSVIKNPFSLWNNQWLTGMPAYADPLSDRFYPFFYPIFILTQDPFIINLILVIHLYIAYLCFFKLSGLMTKNPELRLVSSLFYIFSGTMLSRIYAGHVLLLFALTWIPLLYYAFFKIVWDDEKTVKNISILALSLILILFTGALYYFVYSCLILSVFFIYYFLKKSVSNGALVAVFGAFTVGALIFAIKSIPIVLVSGALDRIDPINPLGDGGSLESILASIVFGTQIDTVFSFWESAVLIGLIPLILIIIALVFGREDRTIPAFFAIIVAFVWAAGGRTLLLFVHLIPILSNFRCAGRILGALLPILLLFAIYGFEIVKTRIKDKEGFTLTPIQKRNVVFGVGLLVFIKLLELPFQTSVSIESWIAVIFIAIFIGMIYFNRVTINNLFIFLLVSCFVTEFIVLRKAYDTPANTGFTVLIILTLIIAAIFFFNREQINFRLSPTNLNYINIFLIIGLCITLYGNASYLQTSDPKLNSSPAIPIVEKMVADNTDGHQLWVLETGWSYQHLDFTYWFVKNGIHPMRAYYGYYMKTTVAPQFTVGDVTYYTPDYVVDTQYLENGQQNLPEVTFTINNISVYKPENVLPSAFVIHEDHLVPATITKFTPDEITITGDFSNGDMVGLKTAYYPGWKANGREMKNTGNMPTDKLTSDTTTITFRYDPLDVKFAGIITVIGIISLIAAIIKRYEIEAYLTKISPIPVIKEVIVEHKRNKKRRWKI